MPEIGATFEFIAATVPGILILGGILMLVLNLTPLNAPSSWGRGLIIVGVVLYLLEMFGDRLGG